MDRIPVGTRVVFNRFITNEEELRVELERGYMIKNDLPMSKIRGGRNSIVVETDDKSFGTYTAYENIYISLADVARLFVDGESEE